MGKLSKIAWTDSTFNPVIGCTKIGPGCDNCYAEALDHRWYHSMHWGAGAPRKLTGDAYWKKPILWNLEAKLTGKPWRVFCASQADVFDNEWPAGVRERLWEMIKATPHLTWLLLTKRVGNVEKMLPADWGDHGYANVHMGITVVNQEEYDRDVPKLKAVRAGVRWLSIEPQLGPIALNGSALWIDWIVVGGESAQYGKCRRFDVEWAVELKRACDFYCVRYFFKQLGSDAWFNDEPLVYKGKGDEPDEWPSEIQVRDFP